MRLGTLQTGGRDGTLIVVSSDERRYVSMPRFPTLQSALEDWTNAEPVLLEAAAGLEGGGERNSHTLPLEIDDLAAPLPRAWQWLDGSVYPSHGALMDKALNITPEKSDAPLMYQGVSDLFYAPRADVPMADEALGIDFEGEFGVIVDEVPMGTPISDAGKHIRLIVQINDWSLRALAGKEMKSGFGWIQAKPPCGMAPFAVTPDELGDAWVDFQPGLDLLVDWNGQRFGAAHGAAMAYGFDALVAHAARTRTLVAGTVIGSGTVSNASFREVGSSCIAERRGIEIVDRGAAETAFMKYGDTVRMEAQLPDGRAPFGILEQKVVRP